MMKLLTVVAVLISATVARPDIGLTYRYQPPATAYGIPIPNGPTHYHVPGSEHHQHTIPSGSYIPSVPSAKLQTPINQQNQLTFAGTDGSLINYGSGGAGVISTIQPSIDQRFTVVGGGALHAPSYSTSQHSFGTRLLGLTPFTQSTITQNSGIVGGGASFQAQTYQQQGTQQQKQIQKHLYFYSAPEEPEQSRPRVNLPVAPAQKNVKIIFIKAPSFRAPAPVHIPLQPQNEEKTLVYVLVKKPEEQPDINIPAPIPTQPTKPEVFFIKYKTQQEAEEAITNVQQGHGHHASISANSVGGDAAFINTIKNDVSATISGGEQLSAGGVSLVSEGNTLSEGGDDLTVSHIGDSGSLSGLTIGGIGGSSTTTTGSSLIVDGGDSSAGIQFGPAGDSGPY